MSESSDDSDNLEDVDSVQAEKLVSRRGLQHDYSVNDISVNQSIHDERKTLFRFSDTSDSESSQK